MKLPPPDEIRRHVLSMPAVRDGTERIAREVEAEATGLAQQRAFDSGSYSSTIREEPLIDGAFRVVATDPKSKWIEEGTGIYGPHKTPIVPRSSKFLVFRVSTGAPAGAMSGLRSSSGLVFALSVKGRKASWVMRDAGEAVAARYGLVFTNHRDFRG